MTVTTFGIGEPVVWNPVLKQYKKYHQRIVERYGVGPFEISNIIPTKNNEERAMACHHQWLIISRLVQVDKKTNKIVVQEGDKPIQFGGSFFVRAGISS